jgi:hypothetical protein
MGIFDKIKGAIFGSASAAPSAPTTVTASKPVPPVAPTSSPSASASAPAPATANAAPSTASASAGAVDVASILNQAVAAKGVKLDWKKSIVDLMKALDLDSGLAARKELATELKYTGDMSDSATMNVWLHKALMQKLSENGGKIPAELLD